MGKYIQWYVVELERLLSGSIPAARLAGTLSEVEAHLTDDAIAIAPACQHGEDPEALAIGRFGSPLKVAHQELTQRGMKRYWQAAIWPMVFTVALGFQLMSVWYRPQAMPVFFGIALLGFVISSFLARRRTPLALTLTCVGIVAVDLVMASFLFAALPNRIPIMRAEYQRIASMTQSELDYLNKNKETYLRGKSLFAKQNPPKGKSEFVTAEGYLVPQFRPFRYDPMLQLPPGHLTTPMDLAVGQASAIMSTEPSWEIARKLWKESHYEGENRIAALKERLEEFAATAKATSWDTFKALLPIAVVTSLMFLAVIYVVNAVCVVCSFYWRMAVLLLRRRNVIA